MPKTKIDLNAPAFGDGAQKVEGTTEETVVEPIVEMPKGEPEVEAPSDEESKVPYSRFKKFHREAKEAREEAEYWRGVAESKTAEPTPSYSDSEALRLWKEMYGDTEASLNYFKLDQARQQRIYEEAQERALEAINNERYQETARVESNLERLDEGFDDLGEMVGRELTDSEQSAILDIVDEFTPKDRQGNYAGEIMPLEKAWEIYELKSQTSKAPRIQSRNTIAGILGNRSQGEPSAVAEANKNWNPFDWDSYKKKI